MLPDYMQKCNQVRDPFVPWVPFNTTQPRYFFFSHHKTGTILSFQVMAMMSEVLSLPCEAVDWGHVMNGVGCSSYPIAVYEDMRPESIHTIMEECPNARAVHLTREAFSSVVSNYVYTKSLQWGDEVPEDVLRGEYLQTLSLEDGLIDECNQDTSKYLPQLGSSALLIDRVQNPNVINIRYEDWTGDFNATSQKIFEHLFGPDFWAIEELVAGASQFDLAMQSQEEVDNNSHVSDVEEKANATAVMADLYAEGVPCTLWIETTDLQMDYEVADAVLNPSSLKSSTPRVNCFGILFLLPLIAPAPNPF
jgi:hypothetical protein